MMCDVFGKHRHSLDSEANRSEFESDRGTCILVCLQTLGIAEAVTNGLQVFAAGFKHFDGTLLHLFELFGRHGRRTDVGCNFVAADFFAFVHFCQRLIVGETVNHRINVGIVFLQTLGDLNQLFDSHRMLNDGRQKLGGIHFDLLGNLNFAGTSQ